MNDTKDCSLLRRLNAVEIELGSLIASALDPRMNVAESREELKKLAQSGAYRNVFITCFATTTSEPKMWLEYTKNGGFAIGFDRGRLESELMALEKNDNGIFYDNCNYSTFSELTHELDKIEAKCAEIVNHGINKDEVLAIGWVFAKIQENLRDMVFPKVPDLRWENEKRLAYVFAQGEVPMDRLRFFGGKPFVTMGLSAPIATYVRCIRISPHGDMQKSRAIAHLVASRIGLSMDYVIDEKMA